jgi:hypothetical protein
LFIKKIAVAWQTRKQRGIGTRKTEGRRSMNAKNNSDFLNKQFLTPEDGQFRPKH